MDDLLKRRFKIVKWIVIDSEKIIFLLDDDSEIFIKSKPAVDLVKEWSSGKEGYEILFSGKYTGKFIILDRKNKTYCISNFFHIIQSELDLELFELLL